MRTSLRAAAGIGIAFVTGVAVAFGVASERGAIGLGTLQPNVLAAPASGVNLSSPTAPAGNLVITANLISNIAKRAEPAVVSVTSTLPGQSVSSGFFNYHTPPKTGLGSGFIISPDGYILTNDHVIDGATRIRVTVNGYPKPFTAKVVGASFALDLALIKIHTPKPLPSLPLGNSSQTRVGQWDIAIGNPYGLSNTLTVGVISAEGRPLTIGNRNYKDLLQTDAPINPGNSGGPLLNLSGQVIGINTAVNASGQGLGFAIPIDTAKNVLTDLMDKGYVPHAWLGVQVTAPSSGTGALVAGVMSQSPAARAGVVTGEIIQAVNGRPVASPQALVNIVSGMTVGQTAKLRVDENGVIRKVVVTLAQEPNNLPSGVGG